MESASLRRALIGFVITNIAVIAVFVVMGSLAEQPHHDLSYL